MEPRNCGGIESHLEATRQAVLKWLDHEEKSTDAAKPKNAFEALAALSEEDEIEPPKQPEILSRMREARRFGVPLFSGEIDTYPSFARREMNCCLDAEQEYLRTQARNLEIRAKHNA